MIFQKKVYSDTYECGVYIYENYHESVKGDYGYEQRFLWCQGQLNELDDYVFGCCNC